MDKKKLSKTQQAAADKVAAAANKAEGKEPETTKAKAKREEQEAKEAEATAAQKQKEADAAKEEADAQREEADDAKDEADAEKEKEPESKIVVGDFPVVAKGIIENVASKSVQRALTYKVVDTGKRDAQGFPVNTHRYALDTVVPNKVKLLKTVSLPHGGRILNRLAADNVDTVTKVGRLEVFFSEKVELTGI